MPRVLKIADGAITMPVKDGVSLATITDQAVGLASSYGVADQVLNDSTATDIAVSLEETVLVEETNVVLDGHVNIYSGQFTDD